ncbi:UDP-N-acetylmuramate dehydrogenase, partial [Pseudomonas lundensis]|nr:UDP-N-acetylmuramate dehydrogenase [Pseudomonas lundensis]
NGSNLLARDKGMRGIVVKIAKNFSHVEIQGEKVTAHSGILLSRLAKMLLREELAGFEFASGIPGTLGGAVTMNAGAYDGEMKDVLEQIEVMEKAGNVFELQGEEMALGYRQSAVQNMDLIVLTATVKLKKGKYQDIKAKMDDLDYRRKSKQPLEWPSAGSTFKRPTGYYAGKLVQDVGLKGFSMGRAQVSELHSGFVINKGDASAAEVLSLIGHIQGKVKDKFGVD